MQNNIISAVFSASNDTFEEEPQILYLWRKLILYEKFHSFINPQYQFAYIVQ